MAAPGRTLGYIPNAQAIRDAAEAQAMAYLTNESWM